MSNNKVNVTYPEDHRVELIDSRSVYGSENIETAVTYSMGNQDQQSKQTESKMLARSIRPGKL